MEPQIQTCAHHLFFFFWVNICFYILGKHSKDNSELKEQSQQTDRSFISVFYKHNERSDERLIHTGIHRTCNKSQTTIFTKFLVLVTQKPGANADL